MAFTVTARHSGNGGETAAQTLTTDSATESASSLLLVGSAAQNDLHTAAQDGQTLSGGSLSYTQVAQSAVVAWDGSANFRMRGAVHSAPISGSPSAHTITIDHYIEGAGGDEGFYCAVAVDVTGHDAAEPVAQSAVNASSLGGGNSESGTVTLAATPTVDNLVVVWFFAGADGGGGFTAPTIGGQSMTERFNQNDNWTQAGCWFRVIDGTESTDVITCSDLGQTVGQYTAVVVEITAESGGAITETVAQIAETDTAQAFGSAKVKTAGQSTETDAAQTVGALKTRALGQATESDTAQSVGSAKAKLLGQAAETDTAQPITALKARTIGLVVETDSAQPIGVAKSRTLGLASETDTTFALTSAKVKVVGQAAETDLAQSVTFVGATPVGQATETDTAQPVTARKTYTIGPTSETDTAQSVTFTSATPIGQSVETDQALTITALKTVGLGQVVETDLALAITGGDVADPNPFSLTHNDPGGLTHREPAGISHRETFAITFQEPA